SREAESHETLAAHEPLIKSMARIAGLTMLAPTQPLPSGTVINVVRDVQVAVRLAGSVDVAAERQRIEKDIKKAEEERAGGVGRGRPTRWSRARPPAVVVEKTERDLAGLDERRAKPAGSLERLKTL